MMCDPVYFLRECCEGKRAGERAVGYTQQCILNTVGGIACLSQDIINTNKREYMLAKVFCQNN